MNDSVQQIDFAHQDEGINELFNHLCFTLSPVPILLSGDSGTGKSFIAGKIADQWNRYHEKNIAIYISGDMAYCQRSCFPFITALSQIKKNKFLKGTVPKGVAELSKGIPFAGDFVGYLIETLGDSAASKKEYDLRYLGDVEKTLVFDFDSLFRDRNVLLVADNLQWMDKDSLAFLQLIIDSLGESYAVFKEIKYLLVSTDAQQVIAEKEWNDIINHPGFMLAKTVRVKRDEYPYTLKKFGYASGLPEDLIKTLYSYTGGHLVLIKRLAIYLSSKNNRETTDINLFENNSDPGYWFIENLLLYRLKEMGASGEQITLLLEYAAVIGVRFTTDELLCISRESEENLKALIHLAQNTELIDASGSNQYFIHEVLRQFFFNRLQDRKFSYFLSFSSCINKLRPSDYLTRAAYQFEAGDNNAAAVTYILAALKNMREGLETSPLVLARIKNSDTGFDLMNYFATMNAAYASYLNTNYVDAIASLYQMEDWIPKPLLAEKYYLLSLCLAKTMIKTDLEQAKMYLMGWDELKEEEGEVWSRLMTTLMTLCINLNDYDRAKELEKKLMFYLSGRIKFDESARYKLNIIRRNSAAAHINEIACVRTFQCVDYFNGELYRSEPSYPVQLYYSLNNHAGNLIVAGDNAGAFDFAQKTMNVVHTFKHIAFPELQIPTNNFILSGVLAGKIPVPEALEMFDIITPYKGFAADGILIKNNIAVTHLYNNDTLIAFIILKELDAQCNEINMDPYYNYFVRSNLAGLYYIKNMDMEFNSLWEELGKHIPAVPDAGYLKKRHELLSDAVGKIERSWQGWNNYLTNLYPVMIGKPWAFYSRGFLVSDIQMWYES